MPSAPPDRDPATGKPIRRVTSAWLDQRKPRRLAVTTKPRRSRSPEGQDLQATLDQVTAVLTQRGPLAQHVALAFAFPTGAPYRHRRRFNKALNHGDHRIQRTRHPSERGAYLLSLTP